MAHNFADLFEHAVDAYGSDRIAVVEGDRELDYDQLDAEANRWAAALAERGVGVGDHVGVHLRNGVDCIAVMLGILKLRAVPVSINYRYVGPELRYLYEYSDITTLVFDREFTPAVAAAAAGLEPLRHLVVVEDGSDAGELPAGTEEHRAVLDAVSPERVAVERSADDPFLIFTGGTTGKPKGVVWRQEDLWRSLAGGSDYYTGEPVADEYAQSRSGLEGAGLRYLMLLPLIHTSGLMPTFTALFAGGTCHFLPHFRSADVWAEIDRAGIGVVIVAGDAMVRPLVDHLRSHDDVDGSSLFMVSSGAAQFTPQVKKELLDLRPELMLMDAFGSSEGGFGGLGMTTRAQVDDGSLFRHHGPRVPRARSMALLDDFDRRLPDDSGEVGWIVKTGYLPSGYYKDPVKTAETFREVDGERVVFTGDRGRYDGEDGLVLLGRASQVINSGGEKIFAEEVEVALKAAPGLADAVVLGIPDERFGQRVGAVVQLEEGARLDLAAVESELRDKLAGYKIPAALWVVETIERHPNSKTDYGWARRVMAESDPTVDRRSGAAAGA